MATNYKMERKFPRYSLDVRATLITSKGEVRVRTLDVSEGGIGLLSPVEIPEGGTFVVELDFPSGKQETFRAEARARSRVGFRYGFSFVNVDGSNMALLRKYVRRWGILAKENYAARD